MQHRRHSGSIQRFVLDLSSPREQARSVPWNRNCSLGDMNVRQTMLDKSALTRSLEQIVTYRFWKIIDVHWPVLIIWHVKARWRYDSKNCLYSRLLLVGGASTRYKTVFPLMRVRDVRLAVVSSRNIYQWNSLPQSKQVNVACWSSNDLLVDS